MRTSFDDDDHACARTRIVVQRIYAAHKRAANQPRPEAIYSSTQLRQNLDLQEGRSTPIIKTVDVKEKDVKNEAIFVNELVKIPIM